MKQRARVTAKGQVTIPVEVRRRLRLHQGDYLVFEVDDDGTTRVRAASDQQTDRFSRFQGSWRDDNGMSIDEINEYIRALRGRDD